MIKCNQPYLYPQDYQNVLSSMDDRDLAMGPVVENFENKMADIIEKNYAIAFSSATTAFDAYFEFILDKGDEVIISPFTFHSVIYSIIRAGGIPVIVDIRQDGLAQNYTQYITAKTKAIVITHIFGKPDIRANDIAFALKNEDIKVVEDCAQAIGATYQGGYVGSARWTDAAIFSFYATKNIHAVEGGVLLTNNKSVDLAMRNLRNNGIASRNGKIILGTNRRMSDIHASIGYSQLDHIKTISLLRNEQANYYNYLLEIDHPESNYTHAYHHYTILVDPKQRYIIHREMKMRGIDLGMYYRYIASEDDALKPYMYINSTPVLDNFVPRILQLPLGLNISLEDQSNVVQSLREVYDGIIIHAA
jgi:perosamine synthetase